MPKDDKTDPEEDQPLKAERAKTLQQSAELRRAMTQLRKSSIYSSGAFVNLGKTSAFANLGKVLASMSPKSDADLNTDLEKIRETFARARIREQISLLENQLRESVDQLSNVDTSGEDKKVEDVNKLRQTIEELNRKREIQHLLDSVSSDAHDEIESSEDFRKRFGSDQEVSAFVVSVDIRRSTELMLKARSPKLFADFITTLCNDLERIFKVNCAVVDKFTGDGILAFFPEFFSGDDAGYFALRSARMANEAFEKRYNEFRSSFTSVLRDVGLGTGIDYGKVHLVRMAGALTIVGQPVVYACRLGGAPAGSVLLNQPAYEVVNEKYPHLTVIEETAINIKSEGALICYDVQLASKKFDPAMPSWMKTKVEQ